ncbi:hypothetical protein GCM10020221_36240 [Streptomyces thioluteus]|uniref:Uncharacterized protein n=1 Tax=Streptomyces thioluteus TaxID=66431 RepID=A0ABN3X7G5_STRTU
MVCVEPSFATVSMRSRCSPRGVLRQLYGGHVRQPAVPQPGLVDEGVGVLGRALDVHGVLEGEQRLVTGPFGMGLSAASSAPELRSTARSIHSSPAGSSSTAR